MSEKNRGRGFQSADPWSVYGEGHPPASGYAWHLMGTVVPGVSIIVTPELADLIVPDAYAADDELSALVPGAMN